MLPYRILNRPITISESAQRLTLEMPANFPVRITLFVLSMLVMLILVVDVSGKWVFDAIKSWSENGFPDLDVSLSSILWLIFIGYFFYSFFQGASGLINVSQSFFWHVFGHQKLVIENDVASISNRVLRWEKRLNCKVINAYSIKSKMAEHPNETARQFARWLELSGLIVEHQEGEETIGVSLSESEVSIVEELLKQRIGK